MAVQEAHGIQRHGSAGKITDPGSRIAASAALQLRRAKPSPEMNAEIPERAITGFHQDDEGHWVAELECGHSQHMRHDPPWQNRAWVLTSEGRSRFIGVRIECRKCERA